MGKLVPKSALDTLIHDEKCLTKIERQNGLFEAKNTAESLPVHSNPSQNSEIATGRFSNVNFIGKSASNVILSLSKDELSISEEVYEKLLELQNKGIDVSTKVP